MGTQAWRPRVGAVVMGFPGNSLGEERCPKHIEEARRMLERGSLDAELYPTPVLTDAEARAAGDALHKESVDAALVILTTFVPDYFLTEFLDGCDRPVFLWAYEWSINSLSLVGGMLVTGALHLLKKPYLLESGALGDEAIFDKFLAFARGAMLKNRSKDIRIGTSGGKNNIMLSMCWDEFALKRIFGLNVINIAIEELYRTADALPEERVREHWEATKAEVSDADVEQADGELSSRYHLAALALSEKYGLSGYSINCYPELKSKICLAVSKLNDGGVAAGCEGDLNSTYMMLLLQALSGRAAFNGDFLWLYRKDNAVLFSHCGAGAFSLAESKDELKLIRSIETCDGCAVCYPTYARGDYTLLNMMMGENGLRVFALKGEAVETDLEYSGTPIKIRFDRSVDDIASDCLRIGTGHHWSGAPGDHVGAVRWLCALAGVEFTVLS